MASPRSMPSYLATRLAETRSPKLLECRFAAAARPAAGSMQRCLQAPNPPSSEWCRSAGARKARRDSRRRLGLGFRWRQRRTDAARETFFKFRSDIIERQIDHRRRKQRQQLAKQQAADDREAQ